MLKLYKTEKSARQAVKNQGLDGMEYYIKYVDAKESGYYVEIVVDNWEDHTEIENRGFIARFS